MSHSQSSEKDHISEEEHAPPAFEAANTGVVTTAEYQEPVYEHKFQWSDLWKPAIVNPINGKSMTFNILRFWDPYATACECSRSTAPSKSTQSSKEFVGIRKEEHRSFGATKSDV